MKYERSISLILILLKLKKKKNTEEIRREYKMERKEYKFVDHAESVHRTVCFAAIFQEHNIAQSRESI